MLTIKEITVKNFMSVGNQAQAIDFSNKSLVLVIGENMDLGGDDAGARNGTGKTTIINALSYVFYGEAPHQHQEGQPGQQDQREGHVGQCQVHQERCDLHHRAW